MVVSCVCICTSGRDHFVTGGIKRTYKSRGVARRVWGVVKGRVNVILTSAREYRATHLVTDHPGFQTISPSFIVVDIRDSLPPFPDPYLAARSGPVSRPVPTDTPPRPIRRHELESLAEDISVCAVPALVGEGVVFRSIYRRGATGAHEF